MTEQPIRALFKNGVFIPQQHVELNDGSTVDLVVRSLRLQPPVVTDGAERRRIMDELIASFKRNPIPAAAKRFTRDELHERG